MKLIFGLIKTYYSQFLSSLNFFGQKNRLVVLKAVIQTAHEWNIMHKIYLKKTTIVELYWEQTRRLVILMALLLNFEIFSLFNLSIDTRIVKSMLFFIAFFCLLSVWHQIFYCVRNANRQISWTKRFAPFKFIFYWK